MLGAYLFYYIGLLILWYIKSENYRTLYLYGITTILMVFVQNFELFMILFIGLLHSCIHRIWPFLTKDGYNIKETPFFDVFCHFLMLFMCYHFIILCPNGLSSLTYLDNAILFWLVISLINVILSSIPVDSETEFVHVIFSWTSLSQAVSTGFWISMLLSYNEYHHPLFLINLYIQVLFSCATWVIFRLNSKILGVAMTYNYIEGVFIICTWYPSLSYIIKYMSA
jgi:hypothetical protein